MRQRVGDRESLRFVGKVFRWVIACATGAVLWAGEPGSRAVLFSLNADDKGGYSLQPVVELQNGRVLEPPVVVSDTGCRDFAAQWYRAGRSYTVLFGGERAGRAVVGRGSAVSVKLNREIRLERTASGRPGDMALATSAPSLGRQLGTRRPPDASERAAALGIARAEFVRRSVPAQLLSRLEMVQLTVSDVNRDGRQDLLGVARIDSVNNTGPVRTLFFVAEGGASGYRPTLARYHSGNGETYSLEVLIDHVDLDGDGIDEILTRAYGWEWFTHRIYSRRGGRWVRTYEGYGCQGA